MECVLQAVLASLDWHRSCGEPYESHVCHSLLWLSRFCEARKSMFFVRTTSGMVLLPETEATPKSMTVPLVGPGIVCGLEYERGTRRHL